LATFLLIYHLPLAEMTLMARDSSKAEMYPRVIIPGSLA